MKRIYTILAGIAGVGLAVGIVLWLGEGKIAAAIGKVGWSGFGIIVGWQFCLFILLATAWRVVTPGASWWRMVWGRLVREGGANVLPFSEVGALVFGARAVTLAGTTAERALASSFADVTAEFLGELPFVLFGFAVLLTRSPKLSMIMPLSIGLALVGVGIAALIWAEKRSAKLFHAIGSRIAKRSEKNLRGKAEALQTELDRLLGNGRRMTLAAAIHLLAWIGGGVTVYITYRLLGGKIPLLQAVALEGMLSAALAVAFLVPAGLGIQEISYIGLGHVFGMPASMSLALSLLRRARDLLIGAPALVGWQIEEAWHLRRTRRPRLERQRRER